MEKDVETILRNVWEIEETQETAGEWKDKKQGTLLLRAIKRASRCEIW